MRVFKWSQSGIPRKKGQRKVRQTFRFIYRRKSKGTIHGLGFKDVETARASVKKIESSGKSHAQDTKAIARNRVRVMGNETIEVHG